MSEKSPARISIGSRRLGPGEPCYVIAEAGSNHNGDLGQALALIDAAAEAGADAVKFQGFRARTLYPETAGQSEYLKDARPIYDIIQAMEMPVEWLPTLAERCRARGVDFLCTPFDEAWVEALDPWVPAFKVASYELSHLPLVRKVLERGKPTFISTGASALGEVMRVVELAREMGNERIVLFQCTAAYPTPPADVNARAIVTLREATGCHVGLSDHSRDPIVAPVVAVALGAVAIEKHFTLSNRLPGPDQRFAVEPDELKDLIRAVRQAQAVLGTGVKEMLAIETELHGFARRSVFSVRAIEAGEAFSEENIRVLRNGANAPGLAPEEYPRLLGRQAASAIAGGSAVTAEMVATSLALREARMSDAGLLWRWANDLETRESSFTRTPIPYADHVAWLTCRLASDATRMWIFADEEVPVGQVRFDILGEVAEIGITVAPEHRGRGYGRVMLAQAIRRLREEKGDRLKPRASVLAHNAASLRLFKACGFEEIGTDRRNGEQVVVLELTGMVS